MKDSLTLTAEHPSAWLAGCLAAWLTGWLVGWIDGWLAGWLAGKVRLAVRLGVMAEWVAALASRGSSETLRHVVKINLAATYSEGV